MGLHDRYTDGTRASVECSPRWVSKDEARLHKLPSKAGVSASNHSPSGTSQEGLATHSVRDSRCCLVAVGDNCPQIAYIELRIPDDAKRVISVQFTVVSHDQGWADFPPAERSWFEARVDPCNKRATPRTIELGRNRPANSDFFEHTWTIDSSSDSLKEIWLNFLRRGDILQLIPMACSLAWANVVRSASIEILYEKLPELDSAIEETDAQIQRAKWFPTLTPDSKTIRVLVVEPGHFDAPIRGSFEIFSLENASEKESSFDALSYCWGETSARAEITMTPSWNSGRAGSKFSLYVPCTVEKALRRLRDAENQLRIWVDSICINQNDDKEKAAQVNIMDQIYGVANTVHIWLGEGHAVTEIALRTTRDIYDLQNRVCPRLVQSQSQCPCRPGKDHRLSVAERERFLGDVTALSMKDLYDIPSIVMDASTKELDTIAGQKMVVIIEHLFSEPWFHRVWVVQEALRARKAVVHCGEQKVHWKEMVAMTTFLDNKRNHANGDWFEHRERSWLPPMWHTLDSSLSSADQPGILEILIGAMDFKATKPRDKLFALYSFARETSKIEEVSNGIKPDYEKTEPQVFADFTRWWIAKYRSLKIFSCIHLHTNRTWRRTISKTGMQQAEKEWKDAKQPTWAVPHEGRSKWSKTLLTSQPWSFCATGGTTPDVHLLSSTTDPLRIHLLGYTQSRIRAIGKNDRTMIADQYMQDLNPGGRYEEMSKVFIWIFDPSGSHGHWTYGFSLNDYKRVEYQARPNGVNGFPDYRDHLWTHWEFEILEKTTGKQRGFMSGPISDDDSYNTTTLTCLDPCFFVAENGMTGICPWKAREGDVIALLHGAKVPYLLRRVESEDDEMDRPADRESAGVYELVGECYVNGIMYGEFMEECQKEGRPPQVFTLV
ncbi:heterokaryon incompatibility protein-domain-containing protein [Phyllosticta capitalensis]|uniref:heterokaryon incompatibility protein-domain-containing protein n=1 Tax=Phyllosticta capitalensis TaxID=121624 RepID=UPI00312DAE45